MEKYEGFEINREALAEALYQEFCFMTPWKNVPFVSKITYSKFLEHADHIISTMPQWLKGVKNETK